MIIFMKRKQIEYRDCVRCVYLFYFRFTTIEMYRTDRKIAYERVHTLLNNFTAYIDRKFEPFSLVATEWLE